MRAALLSGVMALALWPAVSLASEDVVIFAQDIPASEFVGVLYREVLQRPFVVSPAVQASRSLVTVHFKGTREQALREAINYLRGIGFDIRNEGGVDRVEIAVAPKPIEKKEEKISILYRPKFRDASDLAASIKSLFPEARVSSQGGGQEMSSSARSTVSGGTASAPVLAVILGESDAPALRRVLPQIDVLSDDLVIKAAVFEVGLTSDTGSAFGVAINILSNASSQIREFGGSFKGAASGSAKGSLISSSQLIATGAFTSLNLGAASVDAVISSLATDNRFSLLTSPAVRARSGVPTSLSVGQSVPVLGAVSLNRDAGAVQSVEYRDAGVIFTVRPTVVRNTINLEVHQEISDFIKTTTGVNNSPTLTKRSLDGTLSIQDGEIVMLGGLSQRKEAASFQGLALNPLLGGEATAVTRSDLLIVLQVTRVPREAPRGAAPAGNPRTAQPGAARSPSRRPAGPVEALSR